ncbi:MAG: CpaF family protein [Alphaproteobacteria bacterium]|nr:CpaF family protein [Alphaproteobacteria bacterium]
MDSQPLDTQVRRQLLLSLRGRDRQELDQGTVERTLREVFQQLALQGQRLDEPTQARITNEILHEIVLYGPLYVPMFDPEITEIMVNGVDAIFVERKGIYERASVRFADAQQVRAFVSRLVALNEGRRLDQASPMIDLSLPGGARVNVIIPPVVAGSPYITIRKYVRQMRKLDDFIENGSMDGRVAQFLYACIRSHANLLFSGAAGSGKTTLLEILSRYIDERERLVVIEDTMELRFDQPNVARLLSRPPNVEGKGEITIGDLFRNSLRMRPTRIILGELRGPEAMNYLQALNSGHDGSLAVIHASRPLEALLRVEQLAASHHLHIPERVIRRQIAHGLDIIVQHAQLADGTRKVARISEVAGLDEQGDLQVRDIFAFHADGRDKSGNIQGHFEATGVVPLVHRRFELAGAEIDADIYQQG